MGYANEQRDVDNEPAGVVDSHVYEGRGTGLCVQQRRDDPIYEHTDVGYDEPCCVDTLNERTIGETMSEVTPIMSVDDAVGVITKVCRSVQLSADDHDTVFNALGILVAATKEGK